MTQPSLSDHKTILALAQRFGVRPQRRWSQNFLIDNNVLHQIVRSAQVQKGDRILEIGAGFGVLTEGLLATGAQVTAMEIDERLVAALLDRFHGQENFSVLNVDALRWYQEHASDLPRPFQIIANLPYHLSSHFFRTVLESPTQPSRIVVLLQWELAQRIAAPAGTMSLLALSVQYYGEPQVLFRVPKTAFWPMPDVDSALLEVRGIHQGAEHEQEVFHLARMAFSNRRKQLQNSLAAGCHRPVDEILPLMVQANIAGTARPQELSIDDWQRLAVAFLPLLGKSKTLRIAR